MWRNRANSWSVRFGRLGGLGVEVVTERGRLAWAPVGGRDVAPVVDGGGEGNAVVYREVWPGVDLRYTVGAGGVKEDVVLRRRPEVGEFAFRVAKG